jgi:AraC-like DNA-binding protein
MEKAQRLLKNPQVSIKQVASTVGYKHPGDFSQQFKIEYGITPTTWRERRSL